MFRKLVFMISGKRQTFKKLDYIFILTVPDKISGNNYKTKFYNNDFFLPNTFIKPIYIYIQVIYKF